MATPGSWDAIVIGAGPNGLAAGAHLAKAGRKVLILERGTGPGGLSARREFHPGYAVPGILHDDCLTTRKIAARLDLGKHGLAFREAPATYLAEKNGPGLLLDADPVRAAAAIAQRSRHDAEQFTLYTSFLGRIRPLLEAVLGDAAAAHAGQLARLPRSRTARARRHEVEARRHPGARARRADVPIADFLNEKFELPFLVRGARRARRRLHLERSVVGGRTRICSCAKGPEALPSPAVPPRSSPRSPPPRRPPAPSSASPPRSRAIELENGRVAGVSRSPPANPLRAGLVLSSADPKATMLRLLPPGTLPITIEDQFRRIRARGTAARSISPSPGPLELAVTGGKLRSPISVGGGHVDELEPPSTRSSTARPRRPNLEVRRTVGRGSDAGAEGHHVVSILASYAPVDLEGSWTEEAAAFGETVIAALEAARPGSALPRRQRGVDAGRSGGGVRATGGQLHHGEIALDQLLVMRPAPSATRATRPASPASSWAAPVSHPGGGVRPTAGLSPPGSCTEVLGNILQTKDLHYAAGLKCGLSIPPFPSWEYVRRHRCFDICTTS
ncbi:MAG: NAD(P)-binding protein [Thermoanaerobaculia bacterium]